MRVFVDDRVLQGAGVPSLRTQAIQYMKEKESECKSESAQTCYRAYLHQYV